MSLDLLRIRFRAFRVFRRHKNSASLLLCHTAAKSSHSSLQLIPCARARRIVAAVVFVKVNVVTDSRHRCGESAHGVELVGDF